MTKTISITMAIIIMLSAGLATPPMNNSSMTTITASAKTEARFKSHNCKKKRLAT